MEAIRDSAKVPTPDENHPRKPYAGRAYQGAKQLPAGNAGTRPARRRDRQHCGRRELQIELQFGNRSTRKRVTDFADRRLARVTAWERDLKIPVLPVSAERDSVEQLREMLGYAS